MLEPTIEKDMFNRLEKTEEEPAPLRRRGWEGLIDANYQPLSTALIGQIFGEHSSLLGTAALCTGDQLCFLSA